MTTYVVNRFTSGMLAVGRASDVRLAISTLSERDLVTLLQDPTVEVRGMTLHTANLLSSRIGVPISVRAGRFSTKVGDTIVHVSVHGDPSTKACYTVTRSIHIIDAK